MATFAKDIDSTARECDREHLALITHYGRVQARCGKLIADQAAELSQLRAQMIRLRAALIVCQTELACAREDRATLEAAIPGLPKRLVLARRVEALMLHIQDLMRGNVVADTAHSWEHKA